MADLEMGLNIMTTKLIMPILITDFRAFQNFNKINLILINVN